MKDFIEDYLPLVLVLVILTPLAVIAILLWPLAYIFDQRRYKVPKYTVSGYRLGLVRFFCFIHYALKENTKCPNCGYNKNELVKNADV